MRCRRSTTDREVPVDAHAPHIVGDAASERFDAGYVFTPLPECLPSHWYPAFRWRACERIAFLARRAN